MYRFWKMFGDESMIREFYDRMARYARFMEKRCGKSSKIFGEKIKLSEENAKYLVNAGQSSGELWMETGNRLFVITTDPVCTC